MSAEGIGKTVIWVAIILVVLLIVVIVALKLLAYLVIAPYAFAAEDQDILVNKTVTTDNDTTITITCTENLKGLIESCG